MRWLRHHHQTLTAGAPQQPICLCTTTTVLDEHASAARRVQQRKPEVSPVSTGHFNRKGLIPVLCSSKSPRRPRTGGASMQTHTYTHTHTHSAAVICHISVPNDLMRFMAFICKTSVRTLVSREPRPELYLTNIKGVWLRCQPCPVEIYEHQRTLRRFHTMCVCVCAFASAHGRSDISPNSRTHRRGQTHPPHHKPHEPVSKLADNSIYYAPNYCRPLKHMMQTNCGAHPHWNGLCFRMRVCVQCASNTAQFSP